ncbi:MAG: hypothetical protein QOI31_1393 [Solirubrobacterales bacterium]|jgi:uncharacterized membrane protein YeaQ/YmgE (transglycosylase-associated protein family)|nr:hypothetical protein [Solirubrobacterales bacterium]
MDFSEILGAIVLGLLAGFVARALLPGQQSMGLLMTMVLGLAGSFVGFLIFAELLDIGDDDAFDLGGLIGAIIGAMLLLFIYERFVAGSSPRPAAAGSGAPAAPSAGAGRHDKPERDASDREHDRAERRERREHQ